MLPDDPQPPTESLPTPIEIAAPSADNLPLDQTAINPFAATLADVPSAAVAPAVVAVGRPRVWTVFITYIAAFTVGQIVATVVLVVAAVVLFGVPALTANPPQVVTDTIGSLWGMLSANFANQLVVGGTALVAAALSPINWRARLRLGPSNISFGTLAISLIGALALSNAFSCIGGLGLLPESPMIELLSHSMQSLDMESLPFALLLVGVLPGVAEELLFRGYMQTRLTRRWGRHWGVGITAVLFGIMHIDPVHATFACGIGLYLGYLTERAGSIRPAMVCHAINNSIMVLSGFLGWDIEGFLPCLVCLLVSLALLAAALAWLKCVLPFDRQVSEINPVLADTPPAV